MKRNHKLYKETLKRLGPKKMKGVENLIDKKCYGVAERHTVEKLFVYVEGLESQLGIKHIATPKYNGHSFRTLKVRQAGTESYV